MTARRFAAQEPTIFRDLQSTMRKLGATSLRVSPRDLLNPRDNQSEVIWDRAGRRYVVRCKKWPNYLDNLRASERVIYYLHRAVEEYGVTSSQGKLDEAVEQLFSAFEAPPDDTVLMLASGQDRWWERLGVRQAASRVEIINAYRALAKTHHPDAGGEPETFKRLRAAYEEGIAATSQLREAAS